MTRLALLILALAAACAPRCPPGMHDVVSNCHEEFCGMNCAGYNSDGTCMVMMPYNCTNCDHTCVADAPARPR